MRKLVGLISILLLVLFLTACSAGVGGGIGKPKSVNDDKTGNWKYATTSENIDILDYVQEYVDKNMKDGDTHFIINFTNNTTSVINYMGGSIFVDVRERVNREEHSAKTIGSGMTLKEYIIYPDGNVEEVK